MINVQGNVFVTNLKELSPRLIGGTVYSFEKVKDKEEFNATFVKAKFVGNAITFIIQNNIKDKDKVFIKSGILKSNEWTSKDGNVNKILEITIFDLDFVEDKKENDDFKDTPFEEKKSVNQSRFRR